MKKIILILLLLPIVAISQSFNVFDIDTSEYPIMKAKFYSVNENGDQILNHTTSDFEVTENGNPAEVLSVSCPEPLPIPISVGIMVDTKNHINLARHGSERLINFLKMPQNEIGITYMNKRPLMFQDFTKLKRKAINNSKQIPPAPGGTGVSEMFFDDFTGGIKIIKNREAQNRILIFISDLHCPNLNIEEQEVIRQAKDNNIIIYTVLLNTTDYTGLFTRISDNTSGVVFENVKDSSQVKDIFEAILFREQNEPCDISWERNTTCEKVVDIEIFNKTPGLKSKLSQRLNDSQYLALDLDKHFIDFGTNDFDTTITIKSKNGTQRIDDIIFEPDNGNFEVLTPLPINLPNNSPFEIELRLTKKDNSKEYSRMVLIGNYCTSSVGLLKGDKNKPLNQKTLKLTQPNGGEQFIAGADTIITWDGVPEKENIRINFSSNNGFKWATIDSFGVDLKYNWLVPNIESDSCFISIDYFNKKNNIDKEIEWNNTFGGSDNEESKNVIHTNDGGFILSGNTESNSISGVPNTNQRSPFLVKLDYNGDIVWLNIYSNERNSTLESVIQTSDNGYAFVGSKFVAGNLFDLWVVKLKSSGEIDWSRTFGGSGDDYGNSIIQTKDGGLVIAGYTGSDDKNLEELGNNGRSDIWLLKISNSGDIEWSRTYGGSLQDIVSSMIQTKDGGYAITGYSKSYDIDFESVANRGKTDIFFLKVNSLGEKEKINTFGNYWEDYAKEIIQTEDNGYLIVGASEEINPPSFEGFVIRLYESGDYDWSKYVRGFKDVWLNSVVETDKGNFIILGQSESKDQDLEGLNIKGKNDVILLKMDSEGKILLTDSFGGTSTDQSTSLIKTLDDGLVFLGSTNSDNYDLNQNQLFGSNDIWAIKLGPPQPLQSDTSDAVFSIIMPEPAIQNNDIDMGEMIVGNTKDTIISSVICNNGDAPLHVLGVDITGGDDIDFLIPRGAGDFYLKKDECQDMMFEFTPSQLGNRTAVATIMTTIGDFTDTINIRGVGINPLIEATTDVVDFGQFELGDSKDTSVVLIENVGSTDITITETKITGPDTEQFDMTPLPSFTLFADNEKELELNYTAKYGGRTSSIIEFHYDGVGSPLRSMLFAEGIGGEVFPQVPDAFVGERVELGLHLGRIKPEGLDEVATNFTATVSYNSTLLAPIDKNMTVTTESNTSFIEIEGQLSGVSQIATVPMKVGLGTAVSSGLVVTEFQLYDANGDSVDYEIEPGVGEFNVLGICEEGGTRLVNPNGEQVGLKVAQDQMNTNATVSLNLIESGQTDLIIYNQLGNAVETAYSGTPSTGIKELNIDLSNFANGRYYIKLVTPTITKTEIIEIVR